MGLSDFLEEAAGRPFVYGEWDCCLWLADWGRVLTGKDGASRWRGRYHTALGCARLLGREGGVLGVVEAGALEAGLTPHSEPVAGDVGVVRVMDRAGVPRACGAIYTGRRWAVLTSGGVAAFRTEPLAVWGP